MDLIVCAALYGPPKELSLPILGAALIRPGIEMHWLLPKPEQAPEDGRHAIELFGTLVTALNEEQGTTPEGCAQHLEQVAKVIETSIGERYRVGKPFALNDVNSPQPAAPLWMITSGQLVALEVEIIKGITYSAGGLDRHGLYLRDDGTLLVLDHAVL